MIESPVERLARTHPDLEIWWDSSPLVYRPWTEKMLFAAPPDRRAVLEAQLGRLYVEDDPGRSLFRGCTTNPPLSWQAVQADPVTWTARADALVAEHPDAAPHELAWLVYKEVVRRGAERFLPIFEASTHRFGFISGQLDPRLFTEADEMVARAIELHDLAPNVMIKVPASMQGIDVVRRLTALGIPTNTTVCFTLAQILASARAAAEGVRLADADGVDLHSWRAVITMMLGRLTESPALDLGASRRGIAPTWQERHWLGIAVFRRAYRLLMDGGYPSKMLACSLRDGPLVAGKPRFWDVEMLAGGAVVFTCPPYVLEPLFAIGDDLEFGSRIDEPVPDGALGRLLDVPYCLQAYEPDGLELEQFNDHPATVDTVAAFSRGFASLEAFVAERLEHARREPAR